MAARLAPDNVRRVHQSLHHLVADAPWSDEVVLQQVREGVLPAMQKHGPVVCWIVDDTGFPKKGSHSVGVARQYCGQVGKQDNCRVAVSLSVATWGSSLPIAYRLYLPEVWASDRQSRTICPRAAAGLPAPGVLGARVRPERHSPHSITTLRTILARRLAACLPHCPLCGLRSG
jgi:DDE superfamily endonuclease